jgi:hypothetical protein
VPVPVVPHLYIKIRVRGFFLKMEMAQRLAKSRLKLLMETIKEGMVDQRLTILK